ncbi:MAG: hypothetical protein WD097_02270 [Balneolales bacterium]
MNNYFVSKFYVLFLLWAATHMITACDVISHNDHDDHTEPWGMVLLVGGSEIAKQEDGNVTYAEGDYLEFYADQESDLVTVRFLDEDGDRFEPEDEEYSLGWEIGNEDVLEIDQHEEDGKWNFHFVGVGSGETYVRFVLFHGDHSDFTSMDFEIQIEDSVQDMKVEIKE